MNHIIKIGIYICCILIGNATGAECQSAQHNSTAINIGDTCPNLNIKLVNYKDEQCQLLKFKKKLIIIDFWALYCTSCIYSFAKLDSLQLRFQKDLQIILINEVDSEPKIANFFNSRLNKAGVKYSLPSTFGTSGIKSLFEHKTMPHYVWLDSNLKVVAVTGSTEVTTINIQDFITGKKLLLPVKNDLNFDRNALFIQNGILNRANLKRQVIFTGYAPGISTYTRDFKSVNGNVYRRYWINYPIVNIYKDVYRAYFPKTQIILEVKDLSRFLPSGDLDKWNQENLYCYEVNLEPNAFNGFEEYLKINLNQNFGLRAVLEKRVLKTYNLIRDIKFKVIERVSEAPSDNLNEPGNNLKFIKNKSISSFVGSLNQIMNNPIIDSTNYKGVVNMQFDPDVFKDIKKLKNVLGKYGFDLIEEMREMDVFVITDKL